METVVITGEKRENLGTKFAKIVRSEGNVPCVVYGKNGAEHFSVHPLDVRPVVYTPDFKLVNLEIGGHSKKAILKDIQFHPVTDNILHIDFLELTEGHAVKASIPVKFKGVSPGVKDGGKLVSLLRNLKVKANPENLVDTLYVDISNLKLGESIRVKNVEPVEGLTIMVEPNSPIASVEIPRALKSQATAEAKEAKAAAKAE